MTKNNGSAAGKTQSYGLPFDLARFFSWVSLVIVLAFSVLLSLFISNNTTTALLNSQKEYALLLAGNLNNQIFRRFTFPVTQISGHVSLSDPLQYKLMDDVVTSLVHGLHIEEVRIYDSNFLVSYSLDPDEVRRDDLYTPGVPAIFEGAPQYFDVLTTMPYLQAMITPNLPERTFQLRTVYPLSIPPGFEQFAQPGDENAILGALEIVQDVTTPYKIAIRAQWLILIGFAVSSFVLFTLLQIMARQAERILGERMARNRQLEQDLHQSEKLASMGRMVASIAHEIRNPLGIIRSSSEFLLKRQNGQDAVSAQMLEAIHSEACRLGSTVNDFLDYAKPKQPRRLTVDAGDVLDKALAFLGGEFERQGLRVETRRAGPLLIAGDPDLLYRALYNVLINAQQAMAGSGVITVTLTGRPDSVEIVVSDSGPGFPAAELDKPLEPFFTTKDTGTGLGLPIVQSIVASHSGTMRLENAPEGGAAIHLVFPPA